MSTPAQQAWTEEMLAAAEQAITERPGMTSAEFAMRVHSILGTQGIHGPMLSRDRAKALLRELESRGKVRRSAGQAMVTFWPAGEGEDAELRADGPPG